MQHAYTVYSRCLQGEHMTKRERVVIYVVAESEENVFMKIYRVHSLNFITQKQTQ